MQEATDIEAIIGKVLKNKEDVCSKYVTNPQTHQPRFVNYQLHAENSELKKKLQRLNKTLKTKQ